MNITRKIQFGPILAFLLGVSVCEGITSIFTVGSTTFTVAELLSPIIMLVLFGVAYGNFFDFFRKVPLGFKIFSFLVIFSIVGGIIYFGSLSVIYRYFVGIIYLLIVASAAVNAFILRNYKKYIFIGLFWGLVFNIIFSLICYLSFSQGAVINLGVFFDRAGMYVPEYSFRSQGFFLEPSHFIRFVGSIFLLVISEVHIKKRIAKYFIVLASIFVILLSTSGSVVIITVGLLLYLIARPKKIKTRKKKFYDAFFFIVFLVVALYFIYLDIQGDNSLSEMVYKIFRGSDITDEGNEIRFSSMKDLLEYINAALVGCGWNLTGTLIQTEGINTVAAFSDIIEMTLEIGFFGIIVYIISVLSLSFSLIKERSDYSVALSISLLIILFLQLGTDYAFNTCIMLVWGLAIGQLADVKQGRIINSGGNLLG